MNNTFSTSEPTPEVDSPSQGFILNVLLFLSALPVFVTLVLFINSSLTETYVYVSAFAGILLFLAIFVFGYIGYIKIAKVRTVLSILFSCLDLLPLFLLILMRWAFGGLFKGMMLG